VIANIHFFPSLSFGEQPHALVLGYRRYVTATEQRGNWNPSIQPLLR
jgi:hypothetical protein